ncbi:MAG TPA: hypothetical protein VFV72_03695 [Candidatus Limnocylindrales bacterium]|nr:hypothetical protein [Candidatus Limnocylindrales bacterium]
MPDMVPEMPATRSCPWCAAVAADEATTCAACGAALAQRESIGDLVIPGLTAIDPALQGLEDRPIRLAGPSPTQGLADGAVLAALVVGGPVGLAALGGVAAVAAAEYAGAARPHAGAPENLGDVGRPSEITLQALERVEQAERDDPDARHGDGASTAGVEPEADAPPDPWRDLPEGQ